MKRLWAIPVAVLVLACLPGPAEAATCADYSSQAAAQRAADTRDGDADGVYCETLPCPCASGRTEPSSASPAAKPIRPVRRESSDPAGCIRPTRVQPIGFSSTKYPTIRGHVERAIARGWPRILVLNRDGAESRRDRLLRGIRTRSGYDRDEYPPGRALSWRPAHASGPRREDVVFIEPAIVSPRASRWSPTEALRARRRERRPVAENAAVGRCGRVSQAMPSPSPSRPYGSLGRSRA